MSKAHPISAQPMHDLVSRLKRSLLRAPENAEQLVELLRSAQEKNLFDPDALAMRSMTCGCAIS
jgi:Mg2+/Co2+ transporter CorC